MKNVFKKYFIISSLIMISLLLNSYKIYTQNSWNQISFSEQNTIRCIYFVSENTGFLIAANNNVYRTNVGGTNWELKNTGVSTIVYSVFFRDENNGWLAGPDSKVYKTTNGGDSWTQISVGIYSLNFNSIFFTDNKDRKSVV